MDKKLCQKLYDELTALKELKFQLGRAIKTAKADRDFIACKYLRQKIREILDGPEGEISKIHEGTELKKLKLKEQYQSQLDVAWKSGLFESNGLLKRIFKGVPLPGQRRTSEKRPLPVIERGNQKYPMPSWAEVQRTLVKNKEVIKEKSKQGFTKMLIVPFGYVLDDMVTKFKEKTGELDQAGLNADGSSNPEKGIFGGNGEKINFNKVKTPDKSYQYPVWDVQWDWEEPHMTYYPRKYTHVHHGGLGKEDAIKINGAWQIRFVEDIPFIPMEGKVVGGRKQLDKKWDFIKGITGLPTHEQVLEAFENRQNLVSPENYKYEKGICPEEYIWMQLTSLLDSKKPILLDYDGWDKTGTAVIGAMIETAPHHDVTVPVGFWQYRREQFLLGADDAVNKNIAGIRTSVLIK